MSEKHMLIFTAVCLFLWLIELCRIDAELRRPDYLKPKSFLKMSDPGDNLLQLTTEKGIHVKHQYITNMWMETQDVVSEFDADHNMEVTS